MRTSAANDCDAFGECARYMRASAKLAGRENRLPFPQCVYCWGPGAYFRAATTSARLELSGLLRSCLCHIPTTNTSATAACLDEQAQTYVYA